MLFFGSQTFALLVFPVKWRKCWTSDFLMLWKASVDYSSDPKLLLITHFMLFTWISKASQQNWQYTKKTKMFSNTTHLQPLIFISSFKSQLELYCSLYVCCWLIIFFWFFVYFVHVRRFKHQTMHAHNNSHWNLWAAAKSCFDWLYKLRDFIAAFFLLVYLPVSFHCLSMNHGSRLQTEKKIHPNNNHNSLHTFDM